MAGWRELFGSFTRTDTTLACKFDQYNGHVSQAPGSQLELGLASMCIVEPRDPTIRVASQFLDFSSPN